MISSIEFWRSWFCKRQIWNLCMPWYIWEIWRQHQHKCWQHKTDTTFWKYEKMRSSITIWNSYSYRREMSNHLNALRHLIKLKKAHVRVLRGSMILKRWIETIIITSNNISCKEKFYEISLTKYLKTVFDSVHVFRWSKIVQIA